MDQFMGSELETSLIKSALGTNLSSPILQVQAVLGDVGVYPAAPRLGL